ncbi:hypothetical protein KAFR_0G01490 [Kazachstania africana CBS 2517]|uniref:Uncharacterized protein n=1 Tax=Kazachstania africana (strain ATCC 22294 / BCRC 22015 / CBS 2517 / CECT 1963 / NBRC 1671 / NRRL Y-8276) TaxID=1071382 RepID=H2AXT3_KAZAF|nr:hypothetical protein KAFR_0G01490 [Kazachstania africana CBS 2517]CCF59183.1 hypothetical protein KAFR_0G01490 [Kazachstania africana CBS 2517]
MSESLNQELLSRLIDRKISLDELDQLEKATELSSFDSQVAFELGTFVKNYASSNFPEKCVVIDITLPNGHCLFRTVNGIGSAFDNDQWIARKQKTAFRFSHSSFFMGCKKGDKSPEDRFFVSSKEYAFHGGAVPLYVKNVAFPIACLTCSGLKQEEDHLLAITCLKNFAVAKD